jgi:hypothetical protein
MKFKTTTLSVAVTYGDDSPIFGETAIQVSLYDEGSGYCIKLQSQEEGLDGGEITLDVERLEEITKQAQILLTNAIQK